MSQLVFPSLVFNSGIIHSVLVIYYGGFNEKVVDTWSSYIFSYV